MYVTLTYENGEKVSKEIDSASTIAVDGVARNGSGENIVGPSVYTGSCEGLIGLAVTSSDETTQARDDSPSDKTDPDHTAVVAGLAASFDAVASAETDEEHAAALEAARGDVDRARAIWPQSADLADAKQQLDELAAAREALTASQTPAPAPGEEAVVEPHVANSEKSVDDMRAELTAAADSEEQAAAITAGSDAEIRDLYAAFTAATTPPPEA